MYVDDGLLFFYEDSGNVTCCCNEMGILSVNINNINLDNNFHEDELAWYSKFKKLKAFRKVFHE